MAEKRAEYFAAGTLVVWVDLLNDELCVSMRKRSRYPQVYRRGEGRKLNGCAGLDDAVDYIFIESSSAG